MSEDSERQTTRALAGAKSSALAVNEKHIPPGHPRQHMVRREKITVR